MKIFFVLPKYFTIIVMTLATICKSIWAAPQQQQYYYNAHSYQYPSSQSLYPQQYQQNANGYYYQAPPPRPQRYNTPAQPKKERSYKDICRMVNTNGFTNPAGVPKCPY